MDQSFWPLSLLSLGIITLLFFIPVGGGVKTGYFLYYFLFCFYLGSWGHTLLYSGLSLISAQRLLLIMLRGPYKVLVKKLIDTCKTTILSALFLDHSLYISLIVKTFEEPRKKSENCLIDQMRPKILWNYWHLKRFLTYLLKGNGKDEEWHIRYQGTKGTLRSWMALKY